MRISDFQITRERANPIPGGCKQCKAETANREAWWVEKRISYTLTFGPFCSEDCGHRWLEGWLRERQVRSTREAVQLLGMVQGDLEHVRAGLVRGGDPLLAEEVVALQARLEVLRAKVQLQERVEERQRETVVLENPQTGEVAAVGVAG